MQNTESIKGGRMTAVIKPGIALAQAQKCLIRARRNVAAAWQQIEQAKVQLQKRDRTREKNGPS